MDWLGICLDVTQLEVQCMRACQCMYCRYNVGQVLPVVNIRSCSLIVTGLFHVSSTSTIVVSGARFEEVKFELGIGIAIDDHVHRNLYHNVLVDGCIRSLLYLHIVRSIVAVIHKRRWIPMRRQSTDHEGVKSPNHR